MNNRLGNGSTIAQKGFCIPPKDGKTRDMGDLFPADHLHSSFTDSVKLTEEQMQAANLQGIGRLRDLREAAALSPALAETLKAYSNAETKAEQQALLNKLVQEWAKTDPDYHVGFTFSTAMFRTANEGVALTPTQAGFIVGYSIPQEYLDKIQHYRQKVATLDAFSGEKSRVMFSMNDSETKRIFSVIDKAYDALNNNLYQALLFRTRLQPYLNEIGLKLENDEFKLDYSGVLAKFGQIHAENPEKAFVDLGEFLAYGSKNESLTELSSLMAQYARTAIESGTFEQYAQALGTDVLEKLGHKFGNSENEHLYGNDLANLLLGGNGNDYLSGYGGNDILDGGEGDDELYGGSGSDVLNGGAGNDKLYGGSNEADTYVFAKGHGQDTVSDSGWNQEHTDTLRFENTNSADAVFTRNGNDLIVKAYGAEDGVTVSNYFSSSSYRYYDSAFADRTLTAADMAAVTVEGRGTEQNESLYGWDTVDVLDGGAGDDYLYGYDGSDRLNGEAGNDYLDGGSGDDVLDGGEGDDELYGGSGSDILDGGAGNDKLYGGSNEADTYVFAKGHGQDTVDDYAWNAEHADTLRFVGASSSGVRFDRTSRDLVVYAYDDAADSVVLSNYFLDESRRKFDFAFEDEVLKQEGVTALMSGVSLEYRAGADGGTVYGFAGQDVISGSADSDTLYGYAGKDKLSGNADNDSLYGGTDDDILSGGAGRDNLYGEESDDTLNGGSEEDYFFGGSGNDRLNGDDGNDSLYGDNGDDLLNGAEGDDYLDGGDGNDVLDGGSGNDRLYASRGFNILTGGTGDDELYGGDDGQDTYVFEKGHGRDTVYDYGFFNDHKDNLRFEGAAFADASFEREGSDLFIHAYGTEDSVKISDYFGNKSYLYYEFEFSDRKIGADGLSKLSLTDKLTGNTEAFFGYAEQLKSGTADSGRDLNENDGGADGGAYGISYIQTVTIQGIDFSEAVFSRSGDDLLIGASQVSNMLNIENYFNNESYRYAHFEFRDKIATSNEITAAVV